MYSNNNTVTTNIHKITKVKLIVILYIVCSQVKLSLHVQGTNPFNCFLCNFINPIDTQLKSSICAFIRNMPHSLTVFLLSHPHDYMFTCAPNAHIVCAQFLNNYELPNVVVKVQILLLIVWDYL